MSKAALNVDAVIVAVLKSLYAKNADFQVVLTDELNSRNLFVNRPPSISTRENDIEDEEVEHEEEEEPVLYRAEWNRPEMSFRLVSPRFALNESLVSTSLRIMLKASHQEMKVHVSIADSVIATMRVEVVDENEYQLASSPTSFVGHLIQHNFASTPWASLVLPAEMMPATHLCIRVDILAIGEARRKGTDVDALPSMSNLLSADVTTTALRELLIKQQPGTTTASTNSPLAAVFTPTETSGLW